MEETTELGRILVLDMVLERMRGLVRLERLSLKGWIVGWSIDEMLIPGGMTLGEVGSSVTITEFI